MSYHGLGLRRSAPQFTPHPMVFTVPPRTAADVWLNPNPSGEVATARDHDIGIPLALQRQYADEIRSRGGPWIELLRRRGFAGLGELPYLDCTKILIEGGTGTACVDENLRRQQANMAERNDAAKAGFVSDCDRDWALNDQQYAAMGLPRPANNCAQRNYGITPVGGYTGSPDNAPIPVTYLPAPAPASVPASTPAQQAVAPKNASVPMVANNTPTAPPPVPSVSSSAAGPIAVSDTSSFVNQEVGGFPVWGLALAASAALFFFGGKR